MASPVKIVSRTNDLAHRDTYSDINNILATFSEISQSKEADSVISKAFSQIIKTQPELSLAWSNNFYSAVFNSLNGQTTSSSLSYVPTGKSARIIEYNRMAQAEEVDACLDEIADACINYNEKKQLVEIVFNEDLEYIPDGPAGEKKRKELEEKKEVLYKEFYKFIQPLNLKSKLHRYVKNFLKTGECCWENVVDKDEIEQGIIDFKFIPTHSFDFAYDKETYEKVGIWVRVLKTKPGAALNYDDGGMGGMQSFRGSAGVFQSYTGNAYPLNNTNRFDDFATGDLIFLPFEELTYVESGEHSPDDLIVYPIIEKARRAYNQLVSTEDSIIIYRLTRAPTRLIFNVGVGMANNSKGAQQVQQLIRRYNVSKSYNSQTATVGNARDPHTMTESFWFMKSANGEGTDVQELSSSIDMGELPDLEYFLKKLWRALKVPAKRFLEPDTVYARSNDNIGQDEYRFCKFIIRILGNFSEALERSYKTHLILMKIWEKLNVSEEFFNIHFCNPLAYELFEQGRILAQRVEMYKSLSENEEFSKSMAMKKFLNYSEDDVEQNWLELEKDMVRQKLIEAKSDAIVEDEIEAFKQQLQAERAVKEREEDDKTSYDSTEDVVDDAISTQKSQQVIQNGVDQMAAQAQQGGNNQQSQRAASQQQQPSPQQQVQQQPPAQQQQEPTQQQV